MRAHLTIVAVLAAAMSVPGHAVAAPAGMITGAMFLDADRDHELDDGEEMVPGARVTLLDAGGTQLDATSADGIGHYGFTVPPGEYVVRPAGHRYGGQPKDVRVRADGEQVSADLPLSGGLVAGVSWWDADRDGIRDGAREAPDRGRTVKIVGVDHLYQRGTRTAPDGGFRFRDVPAGSYEVRVLTTVPERFAPPHAGNDRTHDSDVTASRDGYGIIPARVTHHGGTGFASDVHLGSGVVSGR